MIFIRADANEYIGTGHVMRCLSIAQTLADSEMVLFLTADHCGDHLISQRGFRSICLETDYNYMEPELVVIKDLIREYHADCILVDSYYVTERYFKELSRRCKVFYMDDLNAGCWDVDILINYNVYSTSMDYTAYQGKRTKLLLGTKYVPLREEFQNMGKHMINDSVKDILVSAGGSDPERVVERIIREICPTMSAIRFHFIVGTLNPRAEIIKRLQSENVILHVNKRNLSKLMMRCDMAVAAAGTTLYELCVCGIPTITYTLADNQILGAEEFGRLGVMLDAGDCREDDMFIHRLKNKILELRIDKIGRQQFYENMQKLMDGYGANRIADEMLRFVGNRNEKVF